MTSDEKIVNATIDAMRELDVEQLLRWRGEIADNIQDAIKATEILIDYVICEKLAARKIN